MQRNTLICIISVVMMTISSSVMANDRSSEATSLVMSLVERIQTTIEKEPTQADVRAETNMIIDEYFDYNLIARFAAGQSWQSATDAEKAAYKTTFREVLLTIAETQFEYFRNLEYQAHDAIPKGKKLVVVRGMVHDKTGNLPDTVVSWRVSTREDKPTRIIDVEVENISMLITQQQENTAIIRQNGGKFSALISALEQMAIDIKTSKVPAE